jgi:hypothetical protein
VSRVRIVLILTENWTMRPAPDVADLVTFAIEAERAGLDAVMVREQRAERPDEEHRVTVPAVSCHRGRDRDRGGGGSLSTWARGFRRGCSRRR